RRTGQDSPRRLPAARKMRAPFALWLALAASLAMLAAGCGNGDSAAPAATATVATLPGTEPAPLPPGLDAMLGQVAALRHLDKPSGVRVSYVTRNDVPALLNALLTADDRRQFAERTALYRLIGMLGPEQDYLGAYQAFSGTSFAGVYDPSTKTLWLITSDGAPVDADALDAVERETVAHELTHAIQDGAFGLATLQTRAGATIDGGLAWSA